MEFDKFILLKDFISLNFTFFSIIKLFSVKKYMLFGILTSLLFGCGKKTFDAKNNVAVFPKIADFKIQKGDFKNCYIEQLAGGFFIKQNTSIAPDGVIILKRNDGAIFVREEFVSRAIIRPEWFGAKGDDTTDDFEAFRKAIKKATESKSTFVTSAKKYHLSKPIKFPDGKAGNSCHWEGNGAILDNEVIIIGRSITLKDLNVENSPSNGFSWSRGQGGYFYNLKASDCKQAGFLLGGKEKAQVAWSSFYSLTSIGNQNGFIFDGSHPKNWVNANLFNAFFARRNKEYGVLIKGKANYNTFTNLHCEGNGKEIKDLPAMLIEKSRDNIFIGGHLVTVNNINSSVVVDRGANNTYVGGRYVTGNSRMKKSIDAPQGKIEMSRQVIRKHKKEDFKGEDWNDNNE